MFPTVQAYKGKHPAEKPLALMRHIIATSSREGATVLDPFMGSGTTGKAAQELGRNFIGIELDAGYFDIAERRIAAVQPALIGA
jgi:site-specific DNA-methyltransferase (adenine-specific)